MRITSTNLSQPKEVLWKGKKIITGIYKTPVDGPIFLKRESVDKDHVADRKVHGGVHKACYLFSAGEYPYWKSIYPKLEWNWGMFGENLTVDDLDEKTVRIGDIYEIGTAQVEVSQPREPCYKLGLRFGNQEILAQFIARSCPGTYVRVLKEGEVRRGDSINLISRSANELSVKDFFTLLFSREKDPAILRLALANEALPMTKRNKLMRYIKKGG
ncbi:MAG: MOSC domain-containing protein [Flavobacteriaceae bacterium]